MIEKRQIETTARAESVRAVLFDLDGTLVDTVGLILESMKHATRTVLGKELPDAELMQYTGIPLVKQMQIFAPEYADELVDVYRAHNALVHDELIREYPGTEEALEWLVSGGVPLGVVTSKGRATALRGLELFGLEEYFDVVICSDDVEIHKPDPFPLIVAAQELGIPVEACAYVGDSPFDMEAALRANAVSIAALWGVFTAEEVLKPGPRYAVASMGELVGLLDDLLDSELVSER